MRFKARKCRTLEDVQVWVSEERAIIKDKHRPARTSTDIAHSLSVNVGESPCQSLSSDCLAANGALSLLNLACFLLDRQLAAQAEAFEKEGGFTERLYRRRVQVESGSTCIDGLLRRLGAFFHVWLHRSCILKTTMQIFG